MASWEALQDFVGDADLRGDSGGRDSQWRKKETNLYQAP